MDVSELLNSWGFGDFTGVFLENGVDYEAFLLLDEEVIKELIPKVGPRLKFLQKFKNYINKQKEQCNLEKTDSPLVEWQILEFGEAGAETEKDSNSSFASTVTVASDDYESNQSEEFGFDAIDSPFPEEEQVGDNRGDNRGDNITTNNLKRPHNNLDFLLPSPPAKLAKCSILSKEEFNKYLKKHSDYPIISKKKDNIDDYTRSKITKVAFDFLITKYPPTKIPHDAFIDLSKIITEIFPCEHESIYFIPYQPLTKNSPQLLAGGKLYSKYINYKRLINKEEGRDNKKRTKKKTSINNNEIEINKKLPPPEEVNTANEFLKHNIGPETEIFSNWEKVFDLRRTLLTEIDLHSYFEKYPYLRQPFGYNLLLQDYEKLYPNNINEIYGIWPELSEAILRLAVKREIITEDYFRNCDKEVTAIKYLPLLFSTTTVRCKGKKIWRPSKAEVQESFILQINNLGLLHEKIERRKSVLKTNHETLQPFMVLVEDAARSTSYVVINDTMYLLETPLKALDVCFKIFFALDAKYPVECQQVWTFIQQMVYKINPTKRYGGLNVITTEIHNILKDIKKNLN